MRKKRGRARQKINAKAGAAPARSCSHIGLLTLAPRPNISVLQLKTVFKH